MASTAILIASGALGAGVGASFAVAAARKSVREAIDRAKGEAKTLKSGARREAGAIKKAAENRARQDNLAERQKLDEELEAEEGRIAKKLEKLEDKESKGERRIDALDERRDELKEREQEVKRIRDSASNIFKDADQRRARLQEELERLCGEASADVAARLKARWLEEAQADAAQNLRRIEQSAGDAEYGREAQRLMSVAVSRYCNHFLTERNISNIPIGEATAEMLTVDDSRILTALSEGANVGLKMNESGESIKLEGLDGVGREVARRALKGLERKAKAQARAKEDPAAWVASIRDRLDQEIISLGRKAFQVLKVGKADPEIVQLVGALNYRTSYTQNQWLHAVEASFLAGMMAEEMGLDVRLARRATLMHDIGKALTHKIEGSHAVIGADIARRVGEDEIVANAIGSHHADEPANSIYAYLVAAADAMSGARPGARREQTDGYSTRLDDLERIGRSYDGVQECYAVHGGRELRVYISDKEISDVGAVDLSAEIAEHISEEMTFPGQIKVTVIRSTEVVSVAS